MTSTVLGALTRLVLGWGFAGAALWWVLSVQPAAGPAASLLGRQLTKADLPALPLVIAGGLLSILAVVGRRARSAIISTVLLSLFGLSGWLAMWWLAIEPTGDGDVIAPITPRHGLTESDVVVLPTVAVAAICGIVGLAALWHAAVPYRTSGDPGDQPSAVQAFFGLTDDDA